MTTYFGIGVTLLLHAVAMIMLLTGLFMVMTEWFGFGVVLMPIGVFGIHTSSNLRYSLYEVLQSTSN